MHEGFSETGWGYDNDTFLAGLIGLNGLGDYLSLIPPHRLAGKMVQDFVCGEVWDLDVGVFNRGFLDGAAVRATHLPGGDVGTTFGAEINHSEHPAPNPRSSLTPSSQPVRRIRALKVEIFAPSEATFILTDFP